uniref:Uncharacterized protein n=1 Tax=Caulobacter sp. (strain K31) TaxID=366602 RepID=B0T941_CAUSK
MQLFSLSAMQSARSLGAASGAASAQAPASSGSVVDDFLKVAKQTPAERLRAQMLEKLGKSEDDLKAMDAVARQKIEDQIKQAIREQLTGQDKPAAGAFVDLKA